MNLEHDRELIRRGLPVLRLPALGRRHQQHDRVLYHRGLRDRGEAFGKEVAGLAQGAQAGAAGCEDAGKGQVPKTWPTLYRPGRSRVPEAAWRGFFNEFASRAFLNVKRVPGSS
jgi:hypothetical protein